MRVINLSFEELYGVGIARRPCFRLLNEILDFYSLKEKVLLMINYSPDVGAEVPINKLDLDKGLLVNVEEEDLDKALKDIANVKVIVNDGYERAIAYLNVQEDP